MSIMSRLTRTVNPLRSAGRFLQEGAGAGIWKTLQSGSRAGVGLRMMAGGAIGGVAGGTLSPSGVGSTGMGIAGGMAAGMMGGKNFSRMRRFGSAMGAQLSKYATSAIPAISAEFSRYRSGIKW